MSGTFWVKPDSHADPAAAHLGLDGTASPWPPGPCCPPPPAAPLPLLPTSPSGQDEPAVPQALHSSFHTCCSFTLKLGRGAGPGLLTSTLRPPWGRAGPSSSSGCARGSAALPNRCPASEGPRRRGLRPPQKTSWTVLTTHGLPLWFQF